jgi:hypothetical protein
LANFGIASTVEQTLVDQMDQRHVQMTYLGDGHADLLDQKSDFLESPDRHTIRLDTMAAAIQNLQTTPLPYREHAAPLAAADTRQPDIISFPDREAIAFLEFSCDPFGPSFDEPILLFGPSFDEPIVLNDHHPTAGLELVADTARGHPRLRICLSSTPAARIPLWRSRVRHAFLIAIGGVPVHTIDDVQEEITPVRQSTCQN